LRRAAFFLLAGCSAIGAEENAEPGPPEEPAIAPAASSAAASTTTCSPGPARCADHKRLVTCEDGAPRETLCARGCQPMPAPVPARCARDVEPPAKVLALFASKPYVEDRCAPDPSHEGAQSCRYRVMETDGEVVTLTPTPERAARWIVDASSYAAPIDALFERDRARWEEALALLARHVKNQSSRIFPLAGTIVEDLGQGPRAFGFDRGVVTPCVEGGCACRINSLKPAALCRYRDALGLEADAACRARIGGPTGIEAWRDTCVANHRGALGADANEHFRAAAWDLGKRVQKHCDAGCEPSAVVERVERALGLAR
jgi:hypothetical protein